MNSTRERCALANVVMFEDRQGVRYLEKSFQVLVHPESSVKTVERLDSHLRTTYAVGGGDRIRVTREMWENCPKSVMIEAIGKNGSRKFVVHFDEPEAKPKWVELDF